MLISANGEHEEEESETEKEIESFQVAGEWDKRWPFVTQKC